MELKQATAGQGHLLKEIFLKSIQESCSADYSDAQLKVWLASGESVQRWEKTIGQEHVMVAWRDTEALGFGSLRSPCYLNYLYVHPRGQGKGIARTLIEQMEREARRRSCTYLTSDVSHTARPFFEKQGFEIVKLNQLRLFGVPISNWRMQKRLLQRLSEQEIHGLLT